MRMLGEPLFGYELPLESFQTPTKTVLIHDIECCEGICSYHHPSKHHMVNWPIEVVGIIPRRICPHAIVHPDPDAMEHYKFVRKLQDTMHICDGCCIPPVIPTLEVISLELNLLLELNNVAEHCK